MTLDEYMCHRCLYYKFNSSESYFNVVEAIFFLDEDNKRLDYLRVPYWEPLGELGSVIDSLSEREVYKRAIKLMIERHEV